MKTKDAKTVDYALYHGTELVKVISVDTDLKFAMVEDDEGNVFYALYEMELS